MALKDGLTEDSLNHPSFSGLGYFGYDDFFDFGLQLGLKDSRIIKIIDQMRTENNSVYVLIAHSYLDNETKLEYTTLYKDKLVRLNTSFEKRI
jgi:serine/threonine-protein kinase HipA